MKRTYIITLLLSLCSLFTYAQDSFFDKFANWATNFTGSPGAFLGAMVLVMVWAATGPFFQYSETWQMIINTGTTIITFLMVFLTFYLCTKLYS